MPRWVWIRSSFSMEAAMSGGRGWLQVLVLVCCPGQLVMPINQLSELTQGHQEWTIYVYVSRLWQHRGGTDEGPIKHTDNVFQDTKGNDMYGEIAAGLVIQFMETIKERKVYELRRFLVTAAKKLYKPMEGELMIRFARYTTVREIDDNLMDYPMAHVYLCFDPNRCSPKSD